MKVTSSRAAKSRAVGDEFAISAQLLPGSSSAGVNGTLIKIVNTVTNEVQQLGPFTGTVSTGALDILAHLPYDANGNISSSEHVDLTAHLTISSGALAGTFIEGSESGTITLSQQTTSSVPNKNVVGNWVGNSANGGGITVAGTTYDIQAAIGSQDASNALRNIGFSTAVLAGQTFSAQLGGVVGSTLVISGNLPDNLPPGTVNLAGKPFVFYAQIDPSNPNKVSGELQVNAGGSGFIQVATFVAYRQ